MTRSSLSWEEGEGEGDGEDEGEVEEEEEGWMTYKNRVVDKEVTTSQTILSLTHF